MYCESNRIRSHWAGIFSHLRQKTILAECCIECFFVSPFGRFFSPIGVVQIMLFLNRRSFLIATGVTTAGTQFVVSRQAAAAPPAKFHDRWRMYWTCYEYSDGCTTLVGLFVKIFDRALDFSGVWWRVLATQSCTISCGYIVQEGPRFCWGQHERHCWHQIKQSTVSMRWGKQNIFRHLLVGFRIHIFLLISKFYRSM